MTTLFCKGCEAILEKGHRPPETCPTCSQTLRRELMKKYPKPAYRQNGEWYMEKVCDECGKCYPVKLGDISTMCPPCRHPSLDSKDF